MSTNLPYQLSTKRPTRLTVVLVGCGGTGARIAALMPKYLRRGDSILFIDHDLVEEKNLMRQHFVTRDIGLNKAEVVMKRLAIEAGRVGFFAEYLTDPLRYDEAFLQTFTNWDANCARAYTAGPTFNRREAVDSGTILIGAVDNKEARKALQQVFAWRGGPVAWIDAGNEMRSGQVILSLKSWPIRSLGRVLSAPPYSEEKGTNYSVSSRTLEALFPALVTDNPEEKKPEAAPNCAARIDLQSVTINNLASAWAGASLSWLIDEVPTCGLGIQFDMGGNAKMMPIMQADRDSFGAGINLTATM